MKWRGQGGQIGLCDEKRMKSGVLLKRNLERGGRGGGVTLLVTTLPLLFLDVRINHSLKLPIFVGRSCLRYKMKPDQIIIRLL